MLPNAVATSVIQQTLQSLPSTPQFASSVVSKCMAFGLPCIFKTCLHPAGVSGASDPQNPLSLRGGSATQQVDMERAGFRLNGIEQYCLVSSILLGALAGMLSATLPDSTSSSNSHGFCWISRYVL